MRTVTSQRLRWASGCDDSLRRIIRTAPHVPFAKLVMSPESLSLFAGMPRISVVLTEPTNLRLEVISFFLLVLLLSAVVVRWLWNGLTRDFPRMPRLSYGKALGLIVLWGAVFVLVLAMISGARELMTPGAWKPNGATYKLGDDAKSQEVPSPGLGEDDRRKKLDDLRVGLWAYARVHEGKLPASEDNPAVAPALWQTTHPSGMRFLFVPGRRPDLFNRFVVAYEPELFGDYRFVLFTDGEIRRLTSAELTEALAAKGS